MMDALYQSPVICAVKDDEGLAAALASQGQVIFLLYGTLCSITSLVARVKEGGKTAIVHVDMVDGLASRESAVQYLRQHTRADGIISTKQHMIKAAKELGFITIQRAFLLDSMALDNVVRRLANEEADFVEILPGMMPKIIRKLVALSPVPVIAGGMLCDKEDVIQALGAGATAVSTSARSLWQA